MTFVDGVGATALEWGDVSAAVAEHAAMLLAERLGERIAVVGMRVLDEHGGEVANPVLVVGFHQEGASA